MNSISLPERPLAIKVGIGSVLAWLLALTIDMYFDGLEPEALLVFLAMLSAQGLALTYLAGGGSKSRWCMVIVGVGMFALQIKDGLKTGEWHDLENLAMDVLLIAIVISLSLPTAGQWYRDARDLREDFLAQFPGDYAVIHRRRTVRLLISAVVAMNGIFGLARLTPHHKLTVILGAITFGPLFLWVIIWHAWQWRLGRRVEAGE